MPCVVPNGAADPVEHLIAATTAADEGRVTTRQRKAPLATAEETYTEVPELEAAVPRGRHDVVLVLLAPGEIKQPIGPFEPMALHKTGGSRLKHVQFPATCDPIVLCPDDCELAGPEPVELVSGGLEG